MDERSSFSASLPAFGIVCILYFRNSDRCIIILLVVLSLSCIILCNHMDCGKPGSSVFHYLSEFAHIHIHWVEYLFMCLFAIHTSFPMKYFFMFLHIFYLYCLLFYVEIWKFCICSRDESFVRHMVCRYFLSLSVAYLFTLKPPSAKF